jgi:hypothetical protein
MAIKSYASEVTLHFGPATVRGKLVPIRMPERKPQLHYCTADGKPVKQVYQDDDGNVFGREDLGRAVADEDGNLTQVNLGAVLDAKASPLPVNTFAFTVYDQSDIEQYLFPSNNNAYIFQPVIKNGKKIVEDPTNDTWHEFLNTIVRESGCVFIAKANLRNNEGLFRLSHYQGYLAVQKQLWPEDLNQFEPIHPDLAAVDKAKALSVVRAMVRPFNPDDFTDEATRRLLDAVDTEVDPTQLPAVNSKTMKPEGIDLSSALDAFLQ